MNNKLFTIIISTVLFCAILTGCTPSNIITTNTGCEKPSEIVAIKEEITDIPESKLVAETGKTDTSAKATDSVKAEKPQVKPTEDSKEKTVQKTEKQLSVTGKETTVVTSQNTKQEKPAGTTTMPSKTAETTEKTGSAPTKENDVNTEKAVVITIPDNVPKDQGESVPKEQSTDNVQPTNQSAFTPENTVPETTVTQEITHSGMVQNENGEWIPDPEVVARMQAEWDAYIEEENKRLLEEYRNSTDNYEINSHSNQAMLDEINAYRIENGLNPLTWSNEMEDVANMRAQEISDYTENQHNDLTHDCGTNTGLGENISNRKEDQVLDGWKNSPGHNNFLLNPDITEAAVATGEVTDDNGYTYDGVTAFVAK